MLVYQCIFNLGKKLNGVGLISTTCHWITWSKTLVENGMGRLDICSEFH